MKKEEKYRRKKENATEAYCVIIKARITTDFTLSPL